eukprot:133642_1
MGDKPSSASSKIYVHNHTGEKMQFHVNHQYTGWSTESSGWKTIEDGKHGYMVTANYRIGFGTTGRSNFQVEAKNWMGLTRAAGKGALSNWKCHTLACNDNGYNCNIHVYRTYLEIKSNSGTSETTFNCGNAYIKV